MTALLCFADLDIDSRFRIVARDGSTSAKVYEKVSATQRRNIVTMETMTTAANWVCLPVLTLATEWPVSR